jgi:hypothetical protein
MLLWIILCVALLLIASDIDALKKPHRPRRQRPLTLADCQANIATYESLARRRGITAQQQQQHRFMADAWRRRAQALLEG